MPVSNIAFLSFLAGTLMLTLFASASCLLLKKKQLSSLVTFAVFVSACWSASLAYDALNPYLTIKQLLLWELLRTCSWIAAMLQQIRFCNRSSSPKGLFRLLQACMLLLILVLVFAVPNQMDNLADAYLLLIWSSLTLAVLAIITAEQLFRNSPTNRTNKILSLGLTAIYLYDFYSFTFALLNEQLSPELWQARGLVNGIAALFLSISLLNLKNPRISDKTKMAFSRPVAFYTASLTTAGFFLALIATGSYYVKLFGGTWGTLLQIALLFSAFICVAAMFLSRTLRSHLSVYINKHFFVHKYDYRTEWLNLIHQLNDSSNAEPPHMKAIQAMVSTIKCGGGILWMDNHFGAYLPIAFHNATDIAVSDLEEPANSQFCEILRQQEWIFSPDATDQDTLGKHNECLPLWVNQIPDLYLIVPLMVDDDLIGFMLLHQPPNNQQLTWEDLDLLKTIGREVAGYLSRNEAAELLAQSKQFDTYNKLSAFIMHDLKNLIAQQALVVKNASKHKENPAFIDDMIRTIDNSVQRMSNLLKKLQQTQPTSARTLNLDSVVINAVRKCQDRIPPPSLRILNDSLKVVADEDHLEMIITHVIKNAQEATAAEGYVDVTISLEGKHACVEVEDNGCGMDSDFIKNRLFRPFDTTKSGKGMGIGVYQTREFIRNLGGDIIVKSEPGVGTTFTIYMPADYSETQNTL